MSRWRQSEWRTQPSPPWWPQGEPWPPRRRTDCYRSRRERFLRRSPWWTFLPLWGLFWLATHFTTSAQRGRFPGGLALLLVCAVAAAAVAVGLRLIAQPLADIVSASDRIARRDYRVRLAEPEFGPAWVRDTIRAFNAMTGELEQQDTARRQLMADIAHELRTPLTVMQGKLEGLLDGVYQRDDERLQELLDETRVLARLVEDLRALATAESSTLSLSKEPTNLIALADDVVSSLQAKADALGIAVTVAVDPHEPTVTLDLDPVRIHEVLTNLVANAFRYTPAGGQVRIEIGRSTNGVEVRVVDTGTGIAATDLPRIFDRFYKSPDSAGSGLGLTIARNLIEAHGGTIRAESRAGVGTTIVFTLPGPDASS